MDIKINLSANEYYEQGKIHSINFQYKEAFECYKIAAEQGYAPAQNNLAVCYYDGHGTEKNFTLAFGWFKKSAEQGYKYAITQLALCYENGRGIEQNYDEAMKWYRIAKANGDRSADMAIEMLTFKRIREGK